MNPDTTPEFTHAEAVRIAQEVFAVPAMASALPSERDQNFLLTTAAGAKYVLKFAKSDEERAVLEFQNAVLRHVAERAPTLAVPRVWPTRHGENLTRITDAQGRAYFIRLLGWLDGQLLADITPHDESLWASLGTTMAELDQALQDFTHPAMHRELRWNVQHADRALEHLSLLTPTQQSAVGRFMESWRTIDWSRLRSSVIHGDANDHNVLVRGGRVVGLIDFGDVVRSAVVCDLAIATAYAMLAQARPLDVAASIVRAYHRRLPLASAEIDAVYPLVTARLCMSLCYAAYNAQVKSGDKYQQVTAGPAWSLLQQLTGLSPEAAVATMREACGVR